MNRVRNLTAMVLTAWFAGQWAGAEPSSDGSRVMGGQGLGERIEAFEAHFDAANRLSGVLLIARGDEIIHHKAYGLARVEKGEPNRLDTRIGIASITKILTNVLLSRLIAEGKLELDSPIAKWLPDFPKAEVITIGLLTRHRAGIPHRVTNPQEESLPLSAQDIVDRAKSRPLLFAPGEQSSYSSAGYTVLARCLELATGESYAQLLRTRVFEPAGMKDSIDSGPGLEIPGSASPYVPGRGELVSAPNKSLSFLSGAGSVISTAEDLWRFVQALKAGKLGVPFSALANQGRVGWTGASNGYFSFLDTHPEDQLTCIWVGNSWGGASIALRSALPALARGESVVPVTRPALIATPPPEILSAYVGRYETRAGAWNEVLVRDGELWYADSMILAIGGDRFWHQPWNCELVFVRDETEKVIAVEKREGATITRWPRMGGSDQ